MSFACDILRERMMKKRYLFPLLNISVLIGCGLAVFTVPPETSFKLFALVCLGAILIFNGAMIVRLRAVQKPGYVPKPADKFTSIAVWIVFFAFMAEVVRGNLKYWRAP
jgi:hypothetical protein